LRYGLLARDEQRSPAFADGAQCGQQERRLADSGLTPDEHERSRHEAAAEHSIELRDTCRNPLGLLGADVDESKHGFGGGSRSGGRRELLFEQRSERSAARALSEPTARCVPALGAGMLSRDLRHRETSLERASDEICAERRTKYARTV
jgi:hypothetical protein